MVLIRRRQRFNGKFSPWCSVLTQVRGYIQSTDVLEHAASIPCATEAAWRLGRWDELSELVSVPSTMVASPDEEYQRRLGRTMLNLHEANPFQATESVKAARSSVMESLARAGRESYSRAYNHVVMLQILSEIEESIPVVCSTLPSYDLTRDLT